MKNGGTSKKRSSLNLDQKAPNSDVMTINNDSRGISTSIRLSELNTQINSKSSVSFRNRADYHQRIDSISCQIKFLKDRMNDLRLFYNVFIKYYVDFINRSKNRVFAEEYLKNFREIHADTSLMAVGDLNNELEQKHHLLGQLQHIICKNESDFQRIEKLQQEIDEKNITINELQQNLESLRSIMYEGKISSSSDSSFQNELEHAMIISDRRNKKNKELEMSIKYTKERIKKFAETIHDYSNVISQQSIEIEEYKIEIDHLVEENKRLSANCLECKNHGISFESERDSLLREITEKSAQIETLETCIVNKDEIIDSLNEKIDIIISENNAIKSSMDILSDSFEKSSNQMNSLRTETQIMSFKKKLEQTNKRLNEYEIENNCLKQENGNLKNELYETRSKSSQNQAISEKSIEKYQALNQQFSNAIKLKEEENNTLMKKNAILETEMIKIKEINTKLMKEYEELISNSNSHLDQIALLQEESLILKNLKEEYQATKIEKDVLKTQYSECTIKLQKLLETKSQYIEENQELKSELLIKKQQYQSSVQSYENRIKEINDNSKNSIKAFEERNRYLEGIVIDHNIQNEEQQRTLKETKRLIEQIVLVLGIESKDQIISTIKGNIKRLNEYNNQIQQLMQNEEVLSVQNKEIGTRLSYMQSIVSKLQESYDGVSDELTEKSQIIEEITYQYNELKVQYEKETQESELNYDYFSKIEERNRIIEAQNTDLESQIHCLSDSLETKDKEIESLNSKLHNQMSIFESEKSKLQESYEKCLNRTQLEESKLKDLSSKVFDLSRILNRIRSTFSSDSVEDLPIEISKAISAKNKEIIELSNQVGYMKNKLSSFESSHIKSTHEISQQNSQLTLKLQEKNSVVSELNEQFSKLKTEIEQIYHITKSSNVQELELFINQNIEESQNLKSIIERQSQKLDENVLAIKKLLTDNESLLSSQANIYASQYGYDSINDLLSQFNKQIEQISTHEQTIMSLNTTLSDLQKSNDQMNDQHSKLISDHQALLFRQKEFSTQLSGILKCDDSHFIQKISSIIQNNESLSNGMNSLQEEIIRSFSSFLNDTNDQSLLSNIRYLLKLLSESQKHNDIVINEASSLGYVGESIIEAIEFIKASLNQSRSEIESLSSSLSEIRAVHEELHTKSESFKQKHQERVSMLNKKVTELNKTNDTMMRIKDELVSLISKLPYDVGFLQENLTRTEFIQISSSINN